MKFLCICMSPAIDALVRLDRAPKGEGEIFKDVADEENVGGKTVNVARWLALRGADAVCGGLLGEDNAVLFERELARCGIRDAFLRVPGPTRRNEMVAWDGGAFKINRAAFPSLGADFNPMKALDCAGEGGGGVAILSGSLPPAVPKDFYAKAVAALKKRGWTVVLDASGEALRLGVEARPDVIKPNADECEALVGFVPKDPDGFRKATDALRGKVAHAVISDGGSGAWFDGEFVAAPKIALADTTAAGDTLLAEWCWRVYGLGADAKDAAAWAVAAGSAACEMPGSTTPPPERVKALRDGIPA
jgi:1-phosphofructokinase